MIEVMKQPLTAPLFHPLVSVARVNGVANHEHPSCPSVRIL